MGLSFVLLYALPHWAWSLQFKSVTTIWNMCPLLNHTPYTRDHTIFYHMALSPHGPFPEFIFLRGEHAVYVHPSLVQEVIVGQRVINRAWT